MPKQLDDDLTSYWTALGFSTASWSALEYVLDTHVQLIRKHYGGKEIAAEVPRGLKPTVKFLCRCFRQLDSLRGISHTMLPLLEKVTELSEKRNLIVHGAAVGFFTANGIPLTRLRGAKTRTTYETEEQTVSITEIYAIGHQTAPLAAEIAKIGVFMKSPFPGSVFEDA
jgi:hypothetical protein